MPVAKQELEGSPTASKDAKTGQMNITHKWRCAWSDRFALMDEFVGAGGGVVHPDPQFLNVFAQKATMRPWVKGIKPDTGGLGAEFASYDWAEVTVQFGAPSFEIPLWAPVGGASGPYRLISEQVQPFVEFMTLDHNNFVWDNGDPVKQKEAPGRQEKGLNYTLTVHEVAFVPVSTLNLLGTVNNQLVHANLLGLSFLQGALLFNSMSVQKKVVDDVQVLDYTISFIGLQHSWNQFWHAQTESFRGFLVKSDNSSYFNYPEADFTQIAV